MRLSILEEDKPLHIKRWFYGWYMWLWILRKVRAKKHGAGPMKWRYAFKMAACTRHLVDGQQRGRQVRWVVKAFKASRRKQWTRVK